MTNKHSGMESKTQCDKRTVGKFCHLQKKKKNTQDVFACGNSRREKDSQPADVPQGISEQDRVKQRPLWDCWSNRPHNSNGTCLIPTASDGITGNEEGIQGTIDDCDFFYFNIAIANNRSVIYTVWHKSMVVLERYQRQTKDRCFNMNHKTIRCA